MPSLACPEKPASSKPGRSPKAVGVEQPADPMISAAAAAEELGVHPATIRRMISRGELPAYKLGPKSIRIARSDLDRFKHRRPVTPAWATLGGGAQ